MFILILLALIALVFAIPQSRRVVLDAGKKLMTPLPADFWEMSEFRGEHVESHDDARRID